MANKHKKKNVERKIAGVDETTRQGFDYSFIQELNLGKVTSINNDCDGIEILFENGRILSIFHPSTCCESVWLHEDIKEYKSLIGQNLHNLSIVAGINPCVGGWYYAKLTTCEGNYYNFSFDADQGSGCYSMELNAAIYDNLGKDKWGCRILEIADNGEEEAWIQVEVG